MSKEFHLYNPVTDTHYSNGGFIPLDSPVPFTGGQWAEGPPPEGSTLYIELGPLEKLEAIITQGQIAMSEAPLPDDLQKQIFDLEVFVQNYYKRGAIQLILDSINGFSIDPTRTDVTQGQRAQVDTLKSQMLAVFNA